MTASDTRETVAFTMWKHGALRAAPNVGRKRTAEDFAGASDAERSKWLGLADAAIAAIPAVQVVVKPLEWETFSTECAKAFSVAGKYEVVWGFRSGQVCLDMRGMTTWHDTIGAAKAAAQADYEARIRSALTAQPSPDVVEIDLRAVMMEEIEDAAAKSPWVPPEYAMNEVVSDCCAFLREPRSQSPDVAALVDALEWYADQFCEGFCQDLPSVGYTDKNCERDCGGCKARAALARVKGGA